jgi:adenine/guanine phosphoribosyltransferase-like PRPP-binding protein
MTTYEEDSPKAFLSRVRDHFAEQPIHRDASGKLSAYFGVTDFTEPIDAHVIEDMAQAMVLTAETLSTVDLIVSIADRSGGALTHAVARRLSIPYSLANWYPEGSPGEIEVEKCPGFSGNGVIFLNGLRQGQRVALVMDVLRNGGTAGKLIDACQRAGATVAVAVFGCELAALGGREKLQDVPAVSMVTVSMEGEMTKEAGSPLPATLYPPQQQPSRTLEIKSMSAEELNAKMERVTKSFVGVPIQRNPYLSYPYSFFSLTDFVPTLDPQLVEDMADLCVYYGDFSKCDVLVSEADRGGGPLIQAVAIRTNLPYVMANWYPSGEGVGASSDAQVGFSGQGRIVVNGIVPEARCIFVDDMLSSGGTAEGVVKSIVQLGGIPIEGVFISEKLYPPKTPGELPVRKGMQRLNASFPYFKVTAIAQFIADGNVTTGPANRVGDF